MDAVVGHQMTHGFILLALHYGLMELMSLLLVKSDSLEKSMMATFQTYLLTMF